MEDSRQVQGSSQSFVGSKGQSAGEYHDADFTWEVNLIFEACPVFCFFLLSVILLLFLRRAPILENNLKFTQEHREHLQLEGLLPEIDEPEPGSSIDAEAEAVSTLDSTSWEQFHARDNATARFYKERR